MERYAIDLFDGHCDAVFLRYLSGGGLRRNDGHVDLERMGKYRRCAQFFALFGEPEPTPVRDLSGKTHRELFLEEYALFEREMAANADLAAFCRTGAEAEAAFRSGRRAAFLSVEGAELLDCSLEQLQLAFDQGVRAVNLTWNHANALSGSHKEEPDRGLSEQGKAFVAKMGELGMLVDVSHLSDPGFWDVMELTSGPVIASHSNSRDVFFHTRNLTDRQFTAIIEKHGIVGLNCYTAFLGDGKVTMDTLLGHLEHYLSLGGEKTVALGGDWDGCNRLPQGFEGSWNWLNFYEYLLKRNYPEQLLQDLYFNNLMRTVRAVCTI